MPLRVRVVDAFTSRAFSGNPAAVVLLDSHTFPGDAWMRDVAAEVNLSETAFAHPVPDDPDADWALRWLTPTAEVDMCGHATLATAHVLFGAGASPGPLRFTARCGVLTVRPVDGGALAMDFPAAPLTAVEAPEGLAWALGAEPLSVHDTGPLVGDLLVELPGEKAVRDLAPNLAALARLGCRGVIVTAPADDPGGGHDFVSRFFAPAVGVPEDPVTGSAHTALAPFHAARLGRTELVGLQVSARTGLVRTAVRGDRVELTGSAVTVIDGELLAGPPAGG